MGFGELMNAWVAMDGDALDAVHADQLRKSFDWDLGCSGDELNQLGEVLLTVLLHHLPEPDDDLIRWRIARIVCILLEVLDVHLRHSRNEQFQFFGLEVRDAFLGHDFMEALQELVDLC